MNKDKGADIIAGRKKELSVVAEDQNWRSYINNELRCAELWQQDWGFLADHGTESNRVQIDRSKTHPASCCVALFSAREGTDQGGENQEA